MADLSESLPYYDQISHAARPQTRYVTTTGSSVTGSFAGLVAITESKFYAITSTVTGMSGIASEIIVIKRPRRTRIRRTWSHQGSIAVQKFSVAQV